jgi:ribosomal protein S4
MRGDSADYLIGRLERRLDMAVYRAKFVTTVYAARQFVNHSHVKVNGRRVNIASHPVRLAKRSRSKKVYASSPSFSRHSNYPNAMWRNILMLTTAK